jgi:hypothetical protein
MVLWTLAKSNKPPIWDGVSTLLKQGFTCLPSILTGDSDLAGMILPVAMLLKSKSPW